eukprot:1184599-Prorocentrum_minimum.AAC.14
MHRNVLSGSETYILTFPLRAFVSRFTMHTPNPVLSSNHGGINAIHRGPTHTHTHTHTHTYSKHLHYPICRAIPRHSALRAKRPNQIERHSSPIGTVVNRAAPLALSSAQRDLAARLLKQTPVSETEPAPHVMCCAA